MKHTFFSILFLAAFCCSSGFAQSLKIANFENNGTDNMCDNRFSRYTSGGAEVGAMLEVVDNPLPEAGYNSSAKVLRVYDVNYTGCIKLNLTNAIANAADKLNISAYNALRLKYKVNNTASFGTLNARIKLNGAGDAIVGDWTNTSHDWKNVSFIFPEGAGSVSMIQIFLYYGAAWSASIVDGLEIYIDDVEVYNTSAPAELSAISANGKAVEFFKSDVYDYTVYYPYTQSTSNIPVITVTKANDTQEVSVQPATSMTGTVAQRTNIITVTEGTATKTYNVTYEIVPKLDIYLCLGQSNMSGYGEILPQDEGVIANTYLLTPGTNFITATNPLNRYSTIANSIARISPAYGFALGLQGHTQNPVGLLVNARNGSAIEWWAKGNTEYALYDNTLTRALAAQQWGDIKGIIWHQGCSNSYDPNGYKPKLQALVANFRADLGIPDLYFVAGELGYWRQNGTGSTAFNAMIRTISTFITNADWVSAENLGFYVDATDPHFSRVSAIELGNRYAEKVKAKNYSTSAIQETANNVFEMNVCGKAINVKNLPQSSHTIIYDSLGKKVFETIATDFSHTLPSSGVYFVSNQHSNTEHTQKIIVK